MAFAPVDYGSNLPLDTSGIETARQQHEAVFQDVRQLGGVIEGGSQQIVQGLLHTQSLKATAAVKERQAQTLQFIDSNPYVSKAMLQARMAPDDYAAWHANLGEEYKNADTVPMFTAAGNLFDSEAKQARADAGKTISLPGWRTRWNATEQTESSTIRERYVNRLAADQMISDQRYQTLQAVDQMVDGAVKPEDIQAAATAASTSPWLKPAERKFIMEKTMAAKDSFVAKQAMLGGDTEVMGAELMKLRSDNSASLYPNMNIKQRLDLENQLKREYGFKFAKDTAHNQIVGPNVDENGKVDAVGIETALAKYDGADKEGVTKAVRSEMGDRQNIFNAQMAQLQKVVFSAGQNPVTGEFDYSKAMQDPAARKAAEQLNKDSPGLLSALNREDTRRENIEMRATLAEQREARAQFNGRSADILTALHRQIDDPTTNAPLREMTPEQYDSHLLDLDMTEQDRGKARIAFRQFSKNGGKADERPQKVVGNEIAQAAGDNEGLKKRLEAGYQDDLIKIAHDFIRAHPELPPDKMDDALRAEIHGKMLRGTVATPWYKFDATPREIDWERKPEYAGKDFKLKDGTIIQAKGQKVHVTSPDGKQSGWLPAADAAAAKADGWK